MLIGQMAAMRGIHGDMKKLFDKLTKTHLYWNVVVFAAVLALLIIRWDSLESYQHLAYALMLIMCLHQIEEYRLPGGFVYGFNQVFFRAKEPDHYPGNRLNASTVDILYYILTVPSLLFGSCSPRLSLFFALFGLVECAVHLLLGILAYQRYYVKGKDTIYFPGSATAWLGFLPVSCATIYALSQCGLLTGELWGKTILFLVAYFLLGFMLPTLTLMDKSSPYVYTITPHEGYFYKFQ